MDIRTNDKRILGGFCPRTPIVLLFAVGALLGALSPLLSGSPIFAGIAAAVMLALVFITVSGPVRLFMIIIPALAVMLLTGNVTIPAVYLGFVISFAVSLYLTACRRWFVPVVIGALAYAIAFVIFDPVTALAVFLPIILGMIAALALQAYGLAPTVGLLTLIGSAAAVLVCVVTGFDLAGAGTYLRDYIAGVFLGVSQDILIMDEKTAELLAALMVNMLPGIILAAAELMIWVGCKLALAFFDASRISDIPEKARRIELDVVSGVIFVASFFLSSAFAIEGGDYEMAGAVTDNIMILLSPAFIALGLRSARDRLAARLTRFEIRPTGTPRKAANGTVAFTCFLIPGLSLAIYLLVGVANSFSPLGAAIKRKMKELSDKSNEN